MRTSIASLAAILAASVTAGCAGPGHGPAPAPAKVAASQARVAPGPVNVDTYRTATVRFFAAFRYPEATELEYYNSLEDAVAGATVVVLGRVRAVAVTRTVGATGADAVPYIGVTVEPVEVLRGSLPAAHARTLTVEFMGASASTDDLRASLPDGYAIWVLRNKATLPAGVVAKGPLPTNERDYYRLVSSQGLFVQGESHVVNPLDHGDTPEIAMPGQAAHGPARRDPVTEGVERYATLSSLAAYARGV